MLSVITSHASFGVEGRLISVEVDIRRGLPGIDVIGLPDGAVREAKERVRVAIRNSGFSFPADRILVSLAPASLPKGGSSYDLPIAIGILAASGQMGPGSAAQAMVLGELNLSGMVRPVTGVLTAVGTGVSGGVKRFLVPVENVAEAASLGCADVFGIASLREAAVLLGRIGRGEEPPPCPADPRTGSSGAGQRPGRGCVGLSDIRGQSGLKRALEIAAAGRHNLLLFGPPGSGKTLAARCLPSILPSLSREESLEVTRIHSTAGLLPAGGGLIKVPPFRMPHHSASKEGIIGGGRGLKPGEISLAHHGVLLLDEAPEFGMGLLQSLREPVEEGSVAIARAGASARFPAEFQLILTFNPCPCGNLGRGAKACICTSAEVQRYWRRVGGALLDRIDIRVPLAPARPADMAAAADPEETGRAAGRVCRAVELQRERYASFGFGSNARIPPGHMDAFCALAPSGSTLLAAAAEAQSISSRAFHAILRISRTIADLEGGGAIRDEHVEEAVALRRYGDSDYFWTRD
jgi:magnesium chelatase family protein